jgi:hypothetical protein
VTLKNDLLPFTDNAQSGAIDRKPELESSVAVQETEVGTTGNINKGNWIIIESI